MRNFILLFATMFATISFAQFDQGTWTFGAGQMFTSTATQTYNPFTDEMEGSAADVSYFVIDNLMVSVSLSGNTEAGDEDDSYHVESQMNFGVGARYYIMDGLFAGINLTKVEYSDLDSDGDWQYDNDGHLMTETGFDMALQVGCSKELAFDGKLWFEPMFSVYMPKADVDMPISYGLGAMFRFAF